MHYFFASTILTGKNLGKSLSISCHTSPRLRSELTRYIWVGFIGISGEYVVLLFREDQSSGDFRPIGSSDLVERGLYSRDSTFYLGRELCGTSVLIYPANLIDSFMSTPRLARSLV
jgi:hypothetical protein